MKIQWKDIVGYEGIYQISNDGRVKSIKRKVLWNNTIRPVGGRILPKRYEKQGYQIAGLYIDGIEVKKNDTGMVYA